MATTKQAPKLDHFQLRVDVGRLGTPDQLEADRLVDVLSPKMQDALNALSEEIWDAFDLLDTDIAHHNRLRDAADSLIFAAVWYPTAAAILADIRAGTEQHKAIETHLPAATRVQVEIPPSINFPDARPNRVTIRYRPDSPFCSEVSVAARPIREVL